MLECREPAGAVEGGRVCLYGEVFSWPWRCEVVGDFGGGVAVRKGTGYVSAAAPWW